jgi:hypothetical protein
MRFGINRLLRSGRGAWPGATAARGLRQRDRNRRRLQPALLALEDRRLLSTFTVESIADSAPANSPAQGTLRWAVEQANEATTPSTIDFNLGSSPATITLSQGQLVLSNAADSITIDGPGASSLSISGNDASRVLQVDNGVTASISGLTITDGLVRNFNPGAGLYNDGGTVTLTDCTISGNSALFMSNGIINGFTYSSGGGLYNNGGGSLTLVGSTVSGNYAYAFGGGLANKSGTATLTDCTVSGNSTHLFGGGLENGYGGTLAVSGSLISGGSAYGASGVENDGAATLTDCIISGGTTQRSEGSLVNNGTATITGCTISGNTASGVQNGGGAYPSAQLTLDDCTVSDNTDQGVDNDATATLTDCTISGNDPSEGVAFGGGVENDRTVYLTDCIVDDNGADIGGGLENNGNATLADCTISGNTANVGGVDNEGSSTLAGCTISGNTGGGLVDNDATAVLTDCTISGNASASEGGGIDNYNGSTATLTDCTISGNSAASGGGVYNAGGNFFEPTSTSTVSLTDTIIAANTASGNIASDIGGPSRSSVTGTYNLVGTGGSGGLTSSGHNLLNVANPLLSPLGNYGGSTRTIALLPGSPAIGAGTSVSTVTTDQRGAPRPTSGATDIGAFQDQGYTLVVSSGSGQTATVGQVFAAPLVAVLTENFADAPRPGATISFSAPAMGASAAISSSTAVTDANGLASITATANNIAGSYAVTTTALGVTPAASFSLTNTTAGPTNVTSDLSVSLGGFVYNRSTREFTQTLTFKNIGDAAITGPIELVLLDLSNATLVNQSGVTEGSPYITVLSNGSLGVGQSLTVTLIFADPTLATITYTPEFLAGPIPSDN